MDTKHLSLKRRTVLGAGLALPLVPGLGFAAGKRPSVEDFFRLPAITGLRLAPGGEAVCGLREIKGRLNAVIVDLTTHKTLIITNFTDKDVTGLRWISPDRLIFTLFDRTRGRGDQRPEGWYAINRDASDFLQLSGTDDERLQTLGTQFGRAVVVDGQYTGEVFIQTSSMQAQGQFSSDIKRLNTQTRKATLLTLGGPRNAVSWVADRKNVVRAALSVEQGVSRVHLRDDEQAPWRMIYEFGPEEVDKTVKPLAFDTVGNLYVSAYAGNDNAAIYRLTYKESKFDPTPVLAMKGFDLGESAGDLLFDEEGGSLLGVRYNADREGTFWVDPRVDAIQRAVDVALPGNVNLLGGQINSPKGKLLIYSYSDRDPGRYYLYDASTQQMSQLAVTHPWIKPEEMQPTTFYRYAARDGMSIPAQLTLPKGVSKPPLIVLHYGGPWVRPIEWHWDGTVQFLVSRGYAVLMPAPRASTGFGAKLYKSGWKQWGLGMQDDVTDGVQDLIQRGVVDGNRVGIAGASYGGYLTMMALAKEPKLFKCGINWVGVTDPKFMFTVTWTDFNESDSGRYTLPLLIGDPDKDAEQFKRTSPVERADEIMQPVLMAYGGLDKRVPLINGETMRDALARHNRNVEWVVYPDEGHGWSRLDHNVDFWTRVENFLKKNL